MPHKHYLPTAIEALKVKVSEAEGRMDLLRADMGRLKEVWMCEEMLIKF